MMTMNKTKNLFLDTSVIISKEFGSQILREKIQKSLRNFKKSSTSYTKKEINCSLLKDAIFLYCLLVDMKDLSAVFERLQQYPLTPRRRKRCLAIFSKITNERQLRVADAITRLESLIVGLHSLLFRDISLIPTKTLCPLADLTIESISQIFEISFSCTRKTAKCKIEQFLEENKKNLLKISSKNIGG